MAEQPHPWDRLPTETAKAYAAFLAYCDLGARRSIRAAIQNTTETLPSDSQLTQWKRWSAKFHWVSRALERDEWLVRTADEQVVTDISEWKTELVKRGRELIADTDSEVFLRGARAFTLQHPPIQRVADVLGLCDGLSDGRIGKVHDTQGAIVHPRDRFDAVKGRAGRIFEKNRRVLKAHDRARWCDGV